MMGTIPSSVVAATTQPVPARDFRLNRALGTDLLPPDPMDAVSLRRASELAHDLVHDQLMPDPPSIVLEPGRALTSDSQLLLVAVVDVKDDVMPPHLVLDGGRNICDPLPHEYHQVISVDRPTAAATTSYRLVGPICTPADVVMYGWRLPAAERGDVLAVTLLDVEPDQYGYTVIVPGFGFLRDRFTEPFLVNWQLTRIGAVSPSEIAVSIMAELIALRKRRRQA